jgi:hypothetical protein
MSTLTAPVPTEPAAVEAEQADATSAEASQPASVKKSKKSKKDMSSLFDALGDDGAAGVMVTHLLDGVETGQLVGPAACFQRQQ